MDKQRILIVDDEIRICESLKILLSDLGFNITCFTDGRQALSHIQDQGCDLVLLDLIMPEMDGFTFLSRIKEKFPDVRVIIMTGQGSTDYAVKAMRGGADDFLGKPFEREKLIKRIENTLNTQQLSRQNTFIEEKYRKIFENSVEGMYQATPEGRFISANPAAARIFGYESPEELISTITDIRSQIYAYPEDRDKAVALLRKDGFLKNIELRYRRKNGSIAWVVVNVQAIRDDKGNILYYEGACTDITDRKQAEEALRAKEEQYRTLIETSPDPIIMYDLEGKILSANTQTARLYGVSSVEEFLREIETVFDLLTDDGKTFAAANFRHTLATGTSQKNEYSVRLKNGERIVVEINSSIVKTTTEEPRAFISVIRDISDRKRAERLLREANQRLDAHLENSPVAIVEFDPAFRIIRWSGSAEKTFGWKADEIIGKAIDELRLVFEDDIDLVQQVSEEMLSGSSPKIMNVNRNYRKDGSVINCEWYNSALYDAHGQLSSILSFILDITDRKQAEAEKAKFEVEYRQLQKAESLNRMAGAIAHHFNNMLMAVTGSLELALDDLSQGTGPHANITAAMEASHRAADMGRSMRTYLGQSIAKYEPMDLSDACDKSLPMLRAILQKDVTLVIDLPSPGPTISTSTTQMQHILTNMITNASEAFGENGGSIHLNVRTVFLADIPTLHRYPVDWQPQNVAYACLEVKDTGCGIMEENIEKIFDPFFSTKFIGRGLGLPVVLGIVRAHRGMITVESNLGHGSIFQVFLPLSEEEVPRQKDTTVKAPEIEGRCTVLLVEDEEPVRNVTRLMLTRLGFSVIEAGDGVEAVEVFRQHHDEINCVVTDLTMPRMDGWETLTALRQIVPNIPVILASGYDEAQVMAGDHPELPQTFVGKPYKLKELSDAIRRAIGQQGKMIEH